MKKSPASIADLNINWTFCKDDGSLACIDSESCKLFRQLNPDISNLIVIPNQYWLVFDNKEILAGSYGRESLAEYMSYINYSFWTMIGRSIKLKKFVRISDTKFRIVEKKS